MRQGRRLRLDEIEKGETEGRGDFGGGLAMGGVT